MRVFNCGGRRHGLVAVEVIYALGTLGIITLLTVDGVSAYYKTRDRYAWRQVALWAAGGQFQRYRAGAVFDSQPPEAVIPEQVKLKTSVTPGVGDWADFDRVTVTATVELPFRHVVKEQVTGYVRKGRGS